MSIDSADKEKAILMVGNMSSKEQRSPNEAAGVAMLTVHLIGHPDEVTKAYNMLHKMRDKKKPLVLGADRWDVTST